MRAVFLCIFICVSLLAVVSSAEARSCAGKPDVLGVSRVIALDTALGQRFGRMQYREDDFLADREVVLTFDDGPLPRYTKPILAALRAHCTLATFFYVGRMAKAYPDMLKKVYADGHTIAGHTYSHPLNLARRPLASAKYEIERGFLTLEQTLGQKIAPFFRFPGLSDSKPLMAYLRERGVGMFSVDVVSNDSYTRNPKRLARQTMRKLDKLGRGILLFHDIKASTARALPAILAELQKKGYKIVHMKARQEFKPLANDHRKLPGAIARVQQKKWISYKMLTQNPVPLPIRRVRQELAEEDAASNDGSAGDTADRAGDKTEDKGRADTTEEGAMAPEDAKPDVSGEGENVETRDTAELKIDGPGKGEDGKGATVDGATDAATAKPKVKSYRRELKKMPLPVKKNPVKAQFNPFGIFSQ